MSSIASNKNELYQGVKIAYDKILIDYDSIDAAYSRVIGVKGNTKDSQICVCDTIAYLIGWGKLVLKWCSLKSTGQTCELPEVGYQWNELGKLAQAFHHEYRDYQYHELILEFISTMDALLLLISSLSEEVLYRQIWYRKYTLGRMIQLNTSSPMKNMRTKIRRFKKIHCI